VLNQHAKESLDRAEECPMHHHWLMPLAILAHILKLEARGKSEIELHCRQLPQAAQHVHEFDIDLRAIECGLSWDGLVGNAFSFERSL